jgi:hypothetical protein
MNVLLAHVNLIPSPRHPNQSIELGEPHVNNILDIIVCHTPRISRRQKHIEHLLHIALRMLWRLLLPH